MPTKKLKMEDMIGTNEEEKYNNIINNTDNREQNDIVSVLAIQELLSKKKLKTISRLKFEQVSIMSKLYLFSDMFGDTYTKKLADLVLQLQISTNGLGRKELVELVQQRSMFGEVEPKKSSKDIFR